MQSSTGISSSAAAWPGASGLTAGGEAAGLVSSTTSSGSSLFLTLCDNEKALKRIKRLKRSVWASGHLHGIPVPGFRSVQPWFVTLTYVGVDDWESDHIADSMKRYRQWCGARHYPCKYTWVGELQKRGAVHYHLLVWLPRGVQMPKWDLPDGRRKAFWTHGMTNTEKAKAGVGYLMKYLSKLGEFHRFPKGMRLYGVGGLTAEGRAVRSWYNLPEWLKPVVGVGEVRRCKGGGFVRPDGEHFRSPWRREFMCGGLRLTQRDPIPERWHDGAYSTWPTP